MQVLDVLDRLDNSHRTIPYAEYLHDKGAENPRYKAANGIVYPRVNVIDVPVEPDETEEVLVIDEQAAWDQLQERMKEVKYVGLSKEEKALYAKLKPTFKV